MPVEDLADELPELLVTGGVHRLDQLKQCRGQRPAVHVRQVAPVRIARFHQGQGRGRRQLPWLRLRLAREPGVRRVSTGVGEKRLGWLEAVHVRRTV